MARAVMAMQVFFEVDERPQSFKAEASSQGTTPAPEKPKPAPYACDPVDVFNVEYNHI